jgi:hypothetical protein
MTGIYGHTSLKLLAHYDQELLSWKMSEGISVSDSKKFLKTLPKMGTMQNGKLYEQVMSAHPIKEQDYSLLPTPAARDYKGPGTRQMTLPMALLPTPTVMHVRNHDERIEAYQSRVSDYETGKTKGKPGMSTGLAVRWMSKEYRTHWIRLED